MYVLIPSGAEVTAERLEEVDRQLRPAQAMSLGPTPISNHALPPGRWIIKVKAAGFRDVILLRTYRMPTSST